MPAITCRSWPSATTIAVRTSCPLRTNAWSCSVPCAGIRSQAYRSAVQRPPVTHSNELVKWSASRSRNASGEPMPSRANAKMVFFWVSVGTTFALSPSRYAAAKSPLSCEVMSRSSISCRAVSRVTLTTRTSALPYRLAPRTMAGSDMGQLPR
jgi:hypothetical protein